MGRGRCWGQLVVHAYIYTCTIITNLTTPVTDTVSLLGLGQAATDGRADGWRLWTVQRLSVHGAGPAQLWAGDDVHLHIDYIGRHFHWILARTCESLGLIVIFYK